jgi:pimeloyl-ACP methyl ester carboxylesterase
MRQVSRLYRIRTRDGWKIALHNYSQDPPDRAVDTVVLCHGLGSNRYNLDGPGNLSLARFLHAHGWDVWLLELRGAGRSSKPRPWNKLHYNWNVDDYIFHDVPAALRFIRDHAGRAKVHWVGHSMGGMLAYAFLITHGNQWARSVVTLASPSMKSVRSPLLDKIVPLRGLLKIFRRIPEGSAARILSPILARLAPRLGRLVINPDNMDRASISKLLRLAVDDIPTSLILQLASWYEESAMGKHYGFISYSEGLKQISAPLYVIAGAADQLTPPRDMAAAYQAVGSQDKQYDVFGRSTGCLHDYGHVDLVLGKYAHREIFPRILDWLNAHAQIRSQPSLYIP